jgi:hypothetical protein
MRVLLPSSYLAGHVGGGLRAGALLAKVVGGPEGLRPLGWVVAALWVSGMHQPRCHSSLASRWRLTGLSAGRHASWTGGISS